MWRLSSSPALARGTHSWHMGLSHCARLSPSWPQPPLSTLSSIFGQISNLIHEHTISQNNLFNEPLVLAAVFKTGRGKHKKRVGNGPFWIETLTPVPHSILPSLLSSFKNKEDIVTSKKDVICANEEKKIS